MKEINQLKKEPKMKTEKIRIKREINRIKQRQGVLRQRWLNLDLKLSVLHNLLKNLEEIELLQK